MTLLPLLALLYSRLSPRTVLALLLALHVVLPFAAGYYLVSLLAVLLK